MGRKRELIIFGVESTAIEIYELSVAYHKNRFKLIRMIFFDLDCVAANQLEDKVNRTDYIIHYIISFTDYALRKECESFVANYSNFKPFTVINPRSFIANSAKIGRGCYIGANASISSNAKIADHTIINLNASIGHDAIVKEHVVVNPGARVSGNVEIGCGSLVGSNAFIFQRVKVGNYNLIDALTYIHDDLPDNMISSSRNTKIHKNPQGVK